MTTARYDLVIHAGRVVTADLPVLRWNPAAAPLCDTAGAARPGGAWEPVMTVRAGRVVGA